MEFNDLEKQWIKDIDTYGSKEEIERLDMIFSSTQIETYEHTMDNYSMDSSFGEFLHKLRSQGYAFLGVGRAPWIHGGRDMAIVFENVDTFDKYWYHTNSYIIEWWQEQVALYLGKDLNAD